MSIPKDKAWRYSTGNVDVSFDLDASTALALLFEREQISAEDMCKHTRLIEELYLLCEQIVLEHATTQQKEVWELLKMGKTQREMGIVLSPEKPLCQYTICERVSFLCKKLNKYLNRSVKGTRILLELTDTRSEKSPIDFVQEYKQKIHESYSIRAQKPRNRTKTLLKM